MACRNFSAGAAGIVLLSGLPGTGKTTFARALVSGFGFHHIESDAVRRRVAARPSYTAHESACVFARVESEARAVLNAGGTPVVDATNLTSRDRRRFVRVARDFNARLVAVHLTAPEAVVRERLSRARAGYSEAGIRVYDAMRG